LKIKIIFSVDDCRIIANFYIYSAAGEKLTKKMKDNTYQYFAGNMVYNKDKLLNYLLFDEGLVNKVSGGYAYEYQLKDHLGNTRVTFQPNGSATTTTQVAEYYPFGSSYLPVSPAETNKYLYNGKEKQDDMLGGTALDWYDYGARFYDPIIGRWTTPDPLAEKYMKWSAYNYTMDNPIRFIDPNGKDVYTVNKEDDIEFKRKTKKDFDKIRVKGSLSNSMKVDKGVLDHRQSGTDKTKVGYNYFAIMGDKSGQGIFEFLSNNTNVEWSRLKFGEKEMSSSIISTSHEVLTDSGGSDLLNNDPFIKVSDFRGYDHKHPFGDWHPSSASLSPKDAGRKNGDIGMADMLEKRFPNKQLNFRIYTDTDGEYFNYDSKTVIPYELNVVIAIGKKITK